MQTCRQRDMQTCRERHADVLRERHVDMQTGRQARVAQCSRAVQSMLGLF